MLDNSRVKQLLEESKRIFITEQREKLKIALEGLIESQNSHKPIDYSVYNRFFHALKGTGATLGLVEVTHIGAAYEEFLADLEKSNQLETKGNLKIFEGLSKFSEVLEQIELGLELVAAKNPPFRNLKGHETEGYEGGSKETKLDPKNKTILVIDDNEVILKLVKATLSEAGEYNVITCNESFSGIVMCNKIKPDLLILDLMMPDVKGDEIFRTLKQNPALSSMKVLVLSALNRKEEKDKLKNSGVDEYMVKPFLIPDLVGTVNDLIGK